MGAVRRAIFRTSVVLFSLLPVIALGSSRAQRRVTVPDLTADEAKLFEDVRDDRLDAWDAVTAAILASPASAEDRDWARSRWEEWLNSAVEDLQAKPPREKAELLLARMHKSLLTGRYDFFQNDMTRLLLEGNYNCVTSALVFHAAGARLGLDVRGVLVPSHVYVRVVVGDTHFDIETTSAKGFLLAQDDAAYAKFLEQMRLDTEKKSGRKIPSETFSRHEVDAIGVLALLYANRGAFLVEQGRARDAIGQFARAALLAHDERYARDSRDLLIAQAAEARILKGDTAGARRLFEFAIADPGGDPLIAKRLSENIGYCWALEAQAHLDREDFKAALDALTAARQWTGDPAIPHNQAAAWNRWGLKELAAKRYERAADIFKRALHAFPEDEDFVQNQRATYYEWTQSLLGKYQFEEALAKSRTLLTLTPKDRQAVEMYAHIASLWADSKANKGDWAGAVLLLEDALKVAPGVPGVRADLVVVGTNAGVAYAQAGDPTKAAAQWKRVLELDPGATVARQNLDRLNRKLDQR